MQTRNGGAITWNSDNLPVSISQDANNNSSFAYGPGKARYKQVAMNGGVQETTFYSGGQEVFTSGTNPTTYKHTLTAYGRPVVLIALSTSSGNPTLSKQYLLTDHLGSVVGTVDVAGTQTAQSFTAFGQHRDPTTWQLTTGTPPTATVTDPAGGCWLRYERSGLSEQLLLRRPPGDECVRKLQRRHNWVLDTHRAAANRRCASQSFSELFEPRRER